MPNTPTSKTQQLTISSVNKASKLQAMILKSIGIALILSSICALANDSNDELIKLIFDAPCRPNCFEPNQIYSKLQQLVTQLESDDALDARKKSILETTRKMIDIHDEKVSTCKDRHQLAQISNLFYTYGPGLHIHEETLLRFQTARAEDDYRYRTQVSNAFIYIKFFKEKQFEYCARNLRQLVGQQMINSFGNLIPQAKSLAESIEQTTITETNSWRQFVKGAVESWSSEEKIVFGSKRQFMKKKDAEYLPRVRNFVYSVCERSRNTFDEAFELYRAGRNYLDLLRETEAILKMASTCADVLEDKKRFESNFFAEAQKRCKKTDLFKNCFTADNGQRSDSDDD